VSVYSQTISVNIIYPLNGLPVQAEVL